MTHDADPDRERARGAYDDILDRARHVATEAATTLDVAGLRAAADHVDRSTLPVLCEVLRRLHVFPTAAPVTPDGALRASPVVAKYGKLVRRWILDLADAGVLVQEAGRFRAGRLAEVARATAAENPHFDDIATLVEAVLTGRHHVLEYVFGALRPAWFTAYTAAAYDADPIFAYQHRIVGAVAEVLAAAASPARPLRIMEVGAGMGGLAAALLARLQGHPVRYLYTDIAREFLQSGRQRLGAAGDAVSYAVYDINRSPAENGVAADAFDMIVAFDVLHCARHLGRSLGWLQSLLRPGGVLVNEQLTRNRLSHLIFPGLMPGFTDFEDDRMRDCRTLPTPEAWPHLLAAAGFTDCHILPEDAGLLDALGHGVIVARARAPAPAT